MHIVTPKFAIKRVATKSSNLESGNNVVQQPTTTSEIVEKVVNAIATVGPEHHLNHFYFQHVKSAKLSLQLREGKEMKEEASVRV